MAERAGQACGAVRVIRHRPERGQAMLLPLACGCCCCCCCLHSVGGIVGAAVATARSAGHPGETEKRAEASAARIYWSSFGGTLAVFVVLTFLYEMTSDNASGAFVVALAGIVLALPLFHVVAGAVAAIRCRGEHPVARRRVLRITGGSIVGSIAGTALMILIALMLK